MPDGLDTRLRAGYSDLLIRGEGLNTAPPRPQIQQPHHGASHHVQTVEFRQGNTEQVAAQHSEKVLPPTMGIAQVPSSPCLGTTIKTFAEARATVTLFSREKLLTLPQDITVPTT